jgi:hypothetical protein
MQDLQQQLQTLTSYRMEGERIRAKIFEIEKAEKPTKFFYARAKMKQAKTYIKHLQSSNGSLATGKAMLEVASRYYQRLFNHKQTTSSSQHHIWSFLSAKLPLSWKTKLEQPLSIKELQEATNKLSKNKSPGLNGIPIELFQQLPSLLQALLLVWNDSTKNNYTIKSFQIGVISLIHKKNDPAEITNYRPITLLNSDYKIIAKALANRLRACIHTVVGENQCGFIPGRDI